MHFFLTFKQLQLSLWIKRTPWHDVDSGKYCSSNEAYSLRDSDISTFQFGHSSSPCIFGSPIVPPKLNQTSSDFSYKHHSPYRMPLSSNTTTYSVSPNVYLSLFWRKWNHKRNEAIFLTQLFTELPQMSHPFNLFHLPFYNLSNCSYTKTLKGARYWRHIQ